MLKFPVPEGILTLWSSMIIPLEGTMFFEPKAQSSFVTQDAKEMIKVAIHPEYPDQTIAISSILTEEGRKEFGASLEHPRRMPSSQTKEKKPSTGKEQGNTRRVCKTCGCQNNKGSPLPQLVVKSYNDVYKGYHQIKMAKEDKEKTAFITSQGIFCYSKMPFGLKNAGATYRRLVDKAFQKQIDRNLEVYVDDLSAKKSLPFFKALKKCTKKSDFQWTAENEKLKKQIAELPTLTAPREKEELIVYLAAVREADDSLVTTTKVEEKLPDPWTLFTDGSSCIDGSRAGLILTNTKGTKFTNTLRCRFDATNNEAEYEALIAGLRIAKQMGIKKLQANVDSRLVANQVNGSYIAKNSGMIQYLEKVKTLANSFKKFSIKQVPKSENKKADALSKITSTSFAHLTKQDTTNNACICKKDDPGMSRLPGLPPRAKKTATKTDSHHVPVAILQMGIDIAGPFPKGPGKHPQANSLVERANKNLREGIKTQLDERSKDWTEEIPYVLWAHRTMIKSSNRDTPFSLMYIMKVVIPAEIGMPTLRTTKIGMVQNDEALEMNLDLLEERKEQAAIREAKSKEKMEKYYNSKVRNTSFKPRDLVYQNNDASHAKDSGKLSPKWEGPY
uniref:Reverse transcriptase domain-containing protein n=1 Tax=Tanacetum cinerariifolium TaxID=118510 RepID=A0A6L2LBE7_TANCI|nr:reverse transcriptase domain-containing protein [Tanacetum cinerariifolium]